MTFQRPESVSTFRHGLGNLLRAFRAGRMAPVVFGQKKRKEFVLLTFDSFELLVAKAARAYDAAAVPTLIDRLNHPQGPGKTTAAELAGWIGATEGEENTESNQIGYWPSVYDDARELARAMDSEERVFFLRGLFSTGSITVELEDDRLGSRRIQRYTIPPLRPGGTAVLAYVEFVDDIPQIIALVIPDASFSGILADERMADREDEAIDDDE